MYWGASAQSVSDLTGATVTTQNLTMATGTINLFSNRTEAVSGRMQTSDLYWMKAAVEWQAAWLSEQVDAYSRNLVGRQSADGQSRDYGGFAQEGLREWATTLAPLAARALKNLSWKGSRTERRGRGQRMLPGFLNENGVWDTTIPVVLEVFTREVEIPVPIPPGPFDDGNFMEYAGNPYQVWFHDDATGLCLLQNSDNTNPPFWAPMSGCTLISDPADVKVGDTVKWQADGRDWVVDWKGFGYAGVHDASSPTSTNVFYFPDLWKSSGAPIFTSTMPTVDYTFGDTSGGPVYSYAVLYLHHPDGGNNFYVDAVQAWAGNWDSVTEFIKWYKPAPGTTSQVITYDGRGHQGYALPTLDNPAQGTLDSVAPSTVTTSGTFIDTVTMTGTGSGFTSNNVTEVYVSDTPDSGGFALPATFVDANTITFEFPIVQLPAPDDQQYAGTMYVRLPNPGGPANTGVSFDRV